MLSYTCLSLHLALNDTTNGDVAAHTLAEMLDHASVIQVTDDNVREHPVTRTSARKTYNHMRVFNDNNALLRTFHSHFPQHFVREPDAKALVQLNGRGARLRDTAVTYDVIDHSVRVTLTISHNEPLDRTMLDTVLADFATNLETKTGAALTYDIVDQVGFMFGEPMTRF